MTESTAAGAHGLDFVLGRWTVHHRKLADPTDPTCQDWVTFTATSEALPVLDGLGQVDRMWVEDPPEGPPFEGFTLRLFDPADGLWRIWWSSTRAPGVLDTPVVGRAAGGTGVFECDDVIAGHPTRVRFVWQAGDGRPRWTQSFSRDGGMTWWENWSMRLERRGA